MNNKEIKIVKKESSESRCYFNFEFYSPGFCGIFRLHFVDNTKKNQKYKDLKATSVYFDGFINNESSAFEVNYVTDAMLFIERNKQWILEKITL
jgi:hypothetical protein